MKIKKLIRYKVYIDRARMYYSYIQFFMIGYLFAKSIGFGPIVDKHKILTIIIGTPVMILIFLIIGRIDLKLGLIEGENVRHNELNPFNQEILKEIREIKSKLNNNASSRGSKD